MNKRLGIYLGLAGLMLGTWLLAVYLPGQRRQAQLAKDIAASRAQLGEFEQTMRALPLFIKKNNELQKLRRQLNSSLYAKTDILNLFDRLRQEAAAHNLTVTEITPPVEELLKLNAVIEDADKPPFLNLTLFLTGDYVNFGKYVRAIEKKPFFHGINTCSILGSATGDGDVSYSLGFRALLGGDQS